MPQPGQPNPRGEDWLVRKIQELERTVQQLAAANPFGLTGITPKDGGTDFDGYVNINGPMSVTGTLSLPAGIIDNDALLNPVKYASSGLSETSFAIDTAHRKRAVATISIPAGFSEATVMVVASVNGNNSTATADFLTVQAYAGPGVGGTSSAPVAAGSLNSATGSAIQTMTGLSGGTIEVGCYVYSNTGSWVASAASSANVNAIVWFTR